MKPGFIGPGVRLKSSTSPEISYGIQNKKFDSTKDDERHKQVMDKNMFPIEKEKKKNKHFEKK